MTRKHCVFLGSLLLFTLACSSLGPARQASSALDFLYPEGSAAAAPAQEVTLRLPVRVGVAIPPANPERLNYGVDLLTESQRQQLLTRVAEAFRDTKGVASIEVVPSLYLNPGGGFATLDRLKSSLGLDLMALVSYDQNLFTETTRASWTYLTVIGPLIIEGEKNEVRTVMDTVIYDIPSRALLFRAAGESTVGDHSSPLNERRKRRRLSDEGFEAAAEAMITQLQGALTAFEAQARAGSVRGQGTPQIAMFNAKGEAINGPNAVAGAGAFGLVDALLALLAAAGVALSYRRTT